MKLQSKVIILILPVVFFVTSLFGIFGYQYLNENLNNNFNFKNEKIVNETNIYIQLYKKQRIKILDFIANIETINNFVTSTGYSSHSEYHKEVINLLKKSIDLE